MVSYIRRLGGQVKSATHSPRDEHYSEYRGLALRLGKDQSSGGLRIVIDQKVCLLHSMGESRDDGRDSGEQIMDIEAHALADKLGQAIRERNPDLLRQIYADDIRVWHGATGSAMGKDENIGMLTAVFAISSGLEYTDVRRHDIEQGLVQQHTLVGTFDDGANMPGLNACMVIKVAGGKIASIDEYFDAQTFAPVWARLAAQPA
ncbi:nuclear transport factor 2 family protein [Novosphingobium sp. 9U]|uniref:nuclear transport factor 2 family protein n=1 Tax=Novosphingobium sp. 9U TaxID=2653158 RepID=UPI001359FF38|nr:nuclear transport factor 2 family protein [Novosphingobium sp. 9U]